ncbi:MAG: hypothetical protein KAQ79_20290 [Cyclobacteriaceae bacterium]|nr:hypothetical protein [Cyclobacteriaceae bacterium]
MKTINILHELNRLKLVIPLTVIAVLFNTAIFSQSTKNKLKIRMSLDYYNNSDNSRTLNATLYVVKDRQRVPVANEKVYFYVGDISDNNILVSIITDANGLSQYVFPEDYKFPIDEERKVSFTAQFNGNKSFAKKSAKIDVKEIFMELFLSEINSAKTVSVRGYEIGNDNEMVPIEDADVLFYVPRFFNDQIIGEGEFIEGKSQIEFPENIAGDTIGNISIIARIEDHDLYGNVERKVANFRWGTTAPIEEDKSLMTIQISIPTRALWHTNAPLWMIITLIILLVGVWGHYIFVIINLFKLKSLSSKKKITKTVE